MICQIGDPVRARRLSGRLHRYQQDHFVAQLKHGQRRLSSILRRDKTEAFRGVNVNGAARHYRRLHQILNPAELSHDRSGRQHLPERALTLDRSLKRRSSSILQSDGQPEFRREKGVCRARWRICRAGILQGRHRYQNQPMRPLVPSRQ